MICLGGEDSFLEDRASLTISIKDLKKLKREIEREFKDLEKNMPKDLGGNTRRLKVAQ